MKNLVYYSNYYSKIGVVGLIYSKNPIVNYSEFTIANYSNLNYSEFIIANYSKFTTVTVFYYSTAIAAVPGFGEGDG